VQQSGAFRDFREIRMVAAPVAVALDRRKRGQGTHGSIQIKS